MQGTTGGRFEPPLSLHNAGCSSSKSSISLLNASKHLLTSPSENRYFFSQKAVIEIRGKQINLFPKDLSSSDLL